MNKLDLAYELFNTTNAKARIAILESIPKEMISSAYPLISLAMTDKRVTVKVTAAKMLSGRTDIPTVVLRAMCADDSNDQISRKIAIQTVMSHYDSYRRSVLALYVDSDETVRKAAMEMSALSTQGRYVGYRAPINEFATRVLSCGLDDVTAVRKAAVKAVGSYCDIPFELIEKAYKNSEDDQEDALCLCQHSSSVPLKFVEDLCDQGDLIAAILAASGCSQMTTKIATKIVDDAYSDKNINLRSEAIGTYAVDIALFAFDPTLFNWDYIYEKLAWAASKKIPPIYFKAAKWLEKVEKVPIEFVRQLMRVPLYSVEADPDPLSSVFRGSPLCREDAVRAACEILMSHTNTASLLQPEDIEYILTNDSEYFLFDHFNKLIVKNCVTYGIYIDYILTRNHPPITGGKFSGSNREVLKKRIAAAVQSLDVLTEDDVVRWYSYNHDLGICAASSGINRLGYTPERIAAKMKAEDEEKNRAISAMPASVYESWKTEELQRKLLTHDSNREKICDELKTRSDVSTDFILTCIESNDSDFIRYGKEVLKSRLSA